MTSMILKQWTRICFILLLILKGYSLVFSQDAQTPKEITEAFENAKTGNYEQAIPVFKKYADSKDFDDLTTLQISVYLNLGYLATKNEALDVDKVNKLTDDYLQKYGISKTDSLKSVAEISLFYFGSILNSNVGTNEKVIYYWSLIKRHYEENKLPDDSIYADVLYRFSLLYYNTKDFYQAIIFGVKAWHVNIHLWGENNDTSLNILDILAFSNKLIGQPEKAIVYLEKRDSIVKVFFGERNPKYLNSLTTLATAYLDLGDYQKAQEINQKVVELRKEISGENDPDYIMSLGDLAKSYSLNGDYLKALEIRAQLVQLQKEISGEKNMDFLTSLANLGVAYSKLGQYQKALEVKLKVVEIGKEIFGEKDPSYLLNLNNLAHTYSDLNEDQKALEISLKVIELGNQVFSEKDPDYLTCKSNLASIYLRLGDYQKAFDISLDVWEIRKEVLGERHPDYLQSMSFLERLYYGMGDYETSYDACRFNVKWTKERLGDNHPDYLVRLNNLSLTEFRLMKYDSAEYHFSEMLMRTQKMVFKNISLMTETQRAQYWRTIKNYFYPFPMFLEKRLNIYPECTIDAYNYTLFTKGLLLNTSIDFNQLIAEKGSPEAKAKFEELKLLRLQIQRLQEKPIAERHLNVDSLETVAQQKEIELVKISKEYGDYTRNLKINWKDVQTNLKDKDVAIEFVEYPTLTDTIKYAALVLRKGWQYPQMIPLFRKDQIEEFIKQDKNTIYANKFVGKQIRQLIWEPLEKVVSPGERVYFSPAGIYHQLAIENLAASDSTTLGDIYQMYRLSSTKELVTQTAKSKYKIAVLYGGLQYDLDSAKMLAESKKYPGIEKLLAFRGYSDDTTVRKGWEYLGGTLQEVEQINRLMNSQQYLVTEYTGETGNEESFKALSGKSPDIIHIATHGFFQPVEESRKNPFMQMRMGDQQESGGWVDPMLRSGLMLSGGNKAWQGEKIPENIEDGVLTAREISRMDLRGTDLVVLSACETGLGEVSSEGVFGLQRSFKQAGVKNLIMSLWEVNDQATSFMMKEFYTNLLSGEDLRKAFVDAKQKCKEKYQDPQYWAAFVLLN